MHNQSSLIILSTSESKSNVEGTSSALVQASNYKKLHVC